MPSSLHDAELLGSGGTLGVVLVHDICGRGPYIRSVAEALGTMGIPTASVDLFEGKLPATREEGMQLAETVREDGVLAGPARIGVLGFCRGGGYALLGACRRPFDFVVDYYGRIDRAKEVSGLRGPLLLILGSEDERITPWALAELLPATQRAKKRVSVELFPGVRHAFHRPGWEGHDPHAATEAWRRTLAFLSELGSPMGPRVAQR